MTEHFTKTSEHRQVRILVERLSDKRFIEGMFRGRVNANHVVVEACLTGSAVVGTAQTSLFEGRNEAVALVVNSRTDDSTAIDEEIRAPIHIGSKPNHLGKVLRNRLA